MAIIMATAATTLASITVAFLTRITSATVATVTTERVTHGSICQKPSQ